MFTAINIYVGAVAALAAVLLYVLPWEALFIAGTAGVAGLAAFVIVAAFTEANPIQFRVGGPKPVHSSITFLPILACIVTFPHAGSVLAVVVIHLLVELLRKRPPRAIVFNVSQGAVATGLGVFAFRSFGGSLDFTQLYSIVGFLALAVTFFGANLLLVGGYFAIAQRRSYIAIIRDAAGSGGGNLFFDLLASPVALIAALLYAQLYVFGLIIVVLPLLLIRFSYLDRLQLQQANRDLLKVLIKAIETRDPYTSGHSLRVSALAKVIGNAMKLNPSMLRELETAALLHDIGKIDTVYSDIIGKPTSLSEFERLTIQSHSVKGAELLQDLTSLNRAIVRAVLHHHERYDGTGYPDGLIGNKIPLMSRIIMVCDAVDAMLSDRPYRPALSIAQVRGELLRYSGSQFDPAIIRVVVQRGVVERAQAAIRDVNEPYEMEVASSAARN
jgi:putative nucleotidyltransferase with HDIG domain